MSYIHGMAQVCIEQFFYIGVELEKIHNCHPKVEDLSGMMVFTVNVDNFGPFTAINS